MMINAPDDLLEWVVTSFDGWELKPDAPKEIIAKFDEFMNLVNTSMKLER